MRLGGLMTSAGTRHATVTAALACVLAFSVGCGDETESDDAAASATPAPSPSVTTTPSPSASPSQAGAAACSDVWVEGAKLPKKYAGCNDESGFVVKDTLSCSSGQFLVRYDDRFYGVLGGKVHLTESPVTEDDGYRGTVERCRG